MSILKFAETGAIRCKPVPHPEPSRPGWILGWPCQECFFVADTFLVSYRDIVIGWDRAVVVRLFTQAGYHSQANHCYAQTLLS